MRRVRLERPKYDYPTQDIIDSLPDYFAGDIPSSQMAIFEEFTEYCRKNPAFAALKLLDIELGPFQAAILEQMFNTSYLIMVCSRGLSKTFLLALYATLKSMLDQAPKQGEGVKVIMVSASYRQAKLIFDEVRSHIYPNAPLLRECCPKPPIIAADSCYFDIGTSHIKAVPLGADGSTIRGLRGNVVLSDETASIPDSIFETVIAGFGAVSKNPVQSMKREAQEQKLREMGLLDQYQTLNKEQNQIIRAGTAFYQFNHFYKKVQQWRAIINNKITPETIDKSKIRLNEDDPQYTDVHYKDYGLIVLPYTQIPKGFMDEKMLAQNRINMSPLIFRMEYECEFPSDSDGFYKMSQINDASPTEEGKDVILEIQGDPNASYVMGVDPARTTDNFAICIIKLDGAHQKLVYVTTLNKKDFPLATRTVRNLLKNFNVRRLAMDKGGGGLTVCDLFHTKELLLPGEIPLWDINDKDNDDKAGDHSMVEMVDFTPKWISEANYSMLADIAHKRLLFPCTIHEQHYPPSRLEEADIVFEEIEETKREMSKIVVTTTEKANVLHFDIPKMKGAGYERKDRYSAILLANYAAKSFRGYGIEKKNNELFLGGWASEFVR